MIRRAFGQSIYETVFYPDTLGLGEIASIRGRCWGVWGCAPSGPLLRGSAGEAPRSWKLFAT